MGDISNILSLFGYWILIAAIPVLTTRYISVGVNENKWSERGEKLFCITIIDYFNSRKWLESNNVLSQISIVLLTSPSMKDFILRPQSSMMVFILKPARNRDKSRLLGAPVPSSAWRRLLACLTRDHFLALLPVPGGPSVSLMRFCSYSLSIK